MYVFVRCRCVRLTSALSRYGHAVEAELAFVKAIKVAKQAGSIAAFRNAAMFFIIQGYHDVALGVIQDGEEMAMANIAHLNALEPSKQVTSSLTFTYEVMLELHRLRHVATAYRLKTLFWQASPPVAGQAALDRMDELGLQCVMEMLWW